MGWSKGRITVLKRDAGLMLRKENTPGERGKKKKREKSEKCTVACSDGGWLSGGEMTE